MTKQSRRWSSWVLGGAVLAGLVGYPLATHSFAADREREERLDRERHPKIYSAIQALKDAKEELDAAKHDYGGHRKEAVEAIDKAIHHLELARDFDKK